MKELNMESIFHPIDVANWERREEFENFSRAGCGFTLTAQADITALCDCARATGMKLYPLMVWAAIRTANAHREFRYGYEGTFGYYDTVHPLFFDLTAGGNVKSLAAEYREDAAQQVEEIGRVREKYRDSNEYQPQDFGQNVINISSVPWTRFTGLSFSLQYVATYYAPIITFGKYETEDARVSVPMAVYMNHAVCDGSHAALFLAEFERFAASVSPARGV